MKPYYVDSAVTLYHGDCLEIDEWLRADVLVTDPPYGQKILHSMAFTHCRRCLKPSRSRYGSCSDCRTDEDEIPKLMGDDDTAIRDSALKLWGDGQPALVFGTWKAPRPAKVGTLLVWDKGDSPGPGDLSIPWGHSSEEIYVMGRWSESNARRTGSVIRVNRVANGASDKPDHPTPKPVGLLERLIEKCPPGVVADPFAGSGTTLIAARNLGRKAIGVELGERYCEMIARRLDQQAFDFGDTA